jgi:4-hydroxyphenylpyruvate dioxygenase-like putative hemolysin
VNRRRVPPSERDASGPTGRPRPHDSLIHCADGEAGSVRHARKASLLPRQGGVRLKLSLTIQHQVEMHGLRHGREAKALAFLRHRSLAASALEIGTAAVHGEERAIAMPRKAKAAIGMSIAVEFVRRGIAKPTWENRFSIIEQHRWRDQQQRV